MAGKDSLCWNTESIKMCIAMKYEEKQLQLGKTFFWKELKYFKKEPSILTADCTLRLHGFCPFYVAIVGTLEAEKERRKSGLSSRVQFRNQGAEPKYTKEMTLNRQKQKACMEEALWLQVRRADKSNSFAKGTEVGFYCGIYRFLKCILAIHYSVQNKALFWR